MREFFFGGNEEEGETIFVSRLSFFASRVGWGEREKSGINHLGNRYLASAKKRKTRRRCCCTSELFRGEIIPSFLEKMEKSHFSQREHVLPPTGKNVVFFQVLSSQGLTPDSKKRRETGLRTFGRVTGAWTKKRNDLFFSFPFSVSVKTRVSIIHSARFRCSCLATKNSVKPPVLRLFFIASFIKAKIAGSRLTETIRSQGEQGTTAKKCREAECLVWFGFLGAIVRKSHFIHKMLNVKGLFSVHSPNLLQCGEPRSRLDASLRLLERSSAGR